jgi:hypothetical protein
VPLRDGQSVVIDGVVASEGRHGFMTGDLHGGERIDAGSPQIGYRRMAQIVKRTFVSPT